MTLMAWSFTRDVTISSINFTMIPNGVQCIGPMRPAETCFIGMKSRLPFYPDATGHMFSGSVVVDSTNSSGLFKSPEGGLVAIITSNGNGQRLKSPIVRTRVEPGKNMTR